MSPKTTTEAIRVTKERASQKEKASRCRVVAIITVLSNTILVAMTVDNSVTEILFTSSLEEQVQVSRLHQKLTGRFLRKLSVPVNLPRNFCLRPFAIEAMHTIIIL